MKYLGTLVLKAGNTIELTNFETGFKQIFVFHLGSFGDQNSASNPFSRSKEVLLVGFIQVVSGVAFVYDREGVLNCFWSSFNSSFDGQKCIALICQLEGIDISSINLP